MTEPSPRDDGTQGTALIALVVAGTLAVICVGAIGALVLRHGPEAVGAFWRMVDKPAAVAGQAPADANRHENAAERRASANDHPAAGERLTVTDAARAMPMGDMADWFSNDEYPPFAKKHGLEGRVRVTLNVDADGTVSDCTIAVSSGVRSLDLVTCAAAIRFGRFKPAHDATGNPVADRVDMPAVRWQLRSE